MIFHKELRIAEFWQPVIAEAGVLSGIGIETTWNGLMKFDPDRYQLHLTENELEPYPFRSVGITPEQLKQIERGLDEPDRSLPPDGHYIPFKDMPGYAAKNPAALFYWQGYRVYSYRLEPSLFSLRIIAQLKIREVKTALDMLTDDPLAGRMDMMVPNDHQEEYCVYACQDGEALMRHAFKMMNKAVSILMSEVTHQEYANLYSRVAQVMRAAWEQETGRVDTFGSLVIWVEKKVREENEWIEQNKKESRSHDLIRRGFMNCEPVCDHEFDVDSYHCRKCGYWKYWLPEEKHGN